MQHRTGSIEIENESTVLQPCFGTVVNESLATDLTFHVQAVRDVRHLEKCDQPWEPPVASPSKDS